MPTKITGPVRLPDGTAPAHGRIVFHRRASGTSSPLVLPGPVEARIGTNATFSIDLEGDSDGTVYGVLVEYWPSPAGRLVSVRLPDVVVDGTGTFTLAQVSAVQVPARAGDTLEVYQGETINFGMQWLDENDRPRNLTGITITSWLSNGLNRLGLSRTTISLSQGTFELTATAAQTASLSAGRYDWFVRSATGTRTQIRQGQIIIKEVRP